MNISFLLGKRKKIVLKMNNILDFFKVNIILFSIYEILFAAVFKQSENMGTCYATVMADVCI